MNSEKLKFSHFAENVVLTFRTNPYKTFFDVVFLSSFLFLFPNLIPNLFGGLVNPLTAIGQFFFAVSLTLLFSSTLGKMLATICAKTTMKISYFYLGYTAIFMMCLFLK